MHNNHIRKTKKRGISKKLVKVIAILAVILMFGVSAVGAWQFYNSTVFRYTTEAYQIANVVENEFSIEELKKYETLMEKHIEGEISAEELEEMANNSEEYTIHQNTLDDLRTGMEINEVALIYMRPEDFINYDDSVSEPMHYIYDSYYKPDLQFNMGGRYVLLEEYADMTYELLTTGEDPEKDIISFGNFGFTLTANHPIYVGERGTICAFIEVPMSTLIEDILRFVINVILFCTLITAIMTYFAIRNTMKNVLDPIELVCSETEAFVKKSDEKDSIEKQNTVDDNSDTNLPSNRLPISQKLDLINTGDEIESLSRSIMKMEIGINEYIENLTQITAEKERIGAELNVATKIQSAMLPSIFPPFPEKTEIDIYATMDPAKEVGGDFYDFYLLDDDHIALTIADVSGKGVPAALFMVISKTLLKNTAQQGLSPAQILSSVNEQLMENNTSDMFVTVWLGIMQISTGHIVAANAGHEYPCIKTAAGNFEIFKDKHKLALGAMSGVKYQEYEFDLEAGGTLYVYTDGVPEATNSSNKLFGIDQMIEALNTDPKETPENLLRNVRTAIDDFVLDAPQFDDITMLAISRH